MVFDVNTDMYVMYWCRYDACSDTRKSEINASSNNNVKLCYEV